MSSNQSFSYIKNNNRAVLLFHGLTGHPYEMKFFAKELSNNNFDVYCPVLPGHCCGVNRIKESSWGEWLQFALEQFDFLKSQYDEVYVSGLCLGAVLACTIAEERSNISGICGLSTTLFLDGWEMPWYRFLIPFGLSTVLKFFYVFPEAGSYGIKNKRLSQKISATAKDNTSLLDCYPMIAIGELIKIAKYTMKNVKKIKTPMILFHSEEDNLTSTKSSRFMYQNTSSKIKKLVILKNCYHVITLDNAKKQVAQKTVEFFNSVSRCDNLTKIEEFTQGG